MKNMWMVRAGEEAFLYDEFKNKNIVAIGWGIGDVKDKSKEEIKKLLEEKYDNGVGNLDIAASMISKFVNEFEKGDYVITAYSKSTKYLIGLITSDYYFDKEKIGVEVNNEGRYCKIRDVEWLCEIPSDKLSDSTNKVLLSVMTLYNIKEEAKNEILWACKNIS